MRRQGRWTRSRSHAALVLVALAMACGGDGGARGQTDGGEAAKSGAQAECHLVPLAEVTEIMGTTAQFVQRLADPAKDWSACQFKLVELGETFIELTAERAAAADSVFARIRMSAKGMLGQEAEPDRISVGEGGWAYGSNSMSEAAAVARGRVYHAHMEYMGMNEIGNKKEPMIQLVTRMIR